MLHSYACFYFISFDAICYRYIWTIAQFIELVINKAHIELFLTKFLFSSSKQIYFDYTFCPKVQWTFPDRWKKSQAWFTKSPWPKYFWYWQANNQVTYLPTMWHRTKWLRRYIDKTLEVEWYRLAGYVPNPSMHAVTPVTRALSPCVDYLLCK